MYKIAVNENTLFNIEEQGEKTFVNDHEVELDLSMISASQAHILYKYQSYNVEIIDLNQQDKTCKIKVNGTTYKIKAENQFDQLLKQLGMDSLVAGKVAEIRAPMPGLVLKVLVEEHAEVKKGDNLLVLEAMKMENILKSTTDGIISKVAIKQGDKVEKNQILIQFK
jgi:acetyl/propionyl-CoA carboxylase alpha subunit